MLFLSLSAFTANAARSDVLWFDNGEVYATPLEACANMPSFIGPTTPLSNPYVSLIGPSGQLSVNGNYFCYGQLLDGSESFQGGVSGSECHSVNPASYESAGLVCIDRGTDDPDKDTGGTCNGVGNPCNVGNGNKHQTETDFTSSSFSFKRTYNSLNLADIGFGNGWRHNHQPHLIVIGSSITQITGSGRGERWRRFPGGVWRGDSDSDILFTQLENGYEIVKPQGDKEFYNISGQLLALENTNGQRTNYTYNPLNLRLLESITDHYGFKIYFSYQDGRHLSSVTDSLGNVYLYEYDEINNLVSVVYPDLTTDNNEDNPRRTYHYENADFPNHLTGITDENGDRYATWNYDSEGRAISSEHAQTTNQVGQEKVELDFQ